jgi:nanoRNase/pAp phosphatase (c-di-AMP/oligoRNAs hydrolase)
MSERKDLTGKRFGRFVALERLPPRRHGTSAIFSLRSTEEGLDVSEIAKLYGGGGHKHAAGFKVPHELVKF